MLTKYLTIVFLLELTACEQQREQTGNKKELANKVDSIKILLQGSWFGEEYDEHAVFYIKDDTISYIEHFDKYKYSISNDTLDILTEVPNFKEFVIMQLTKDSLILKDIAHDEVQTKKYWRTK